MLPLLKIIVGQKIPVWIFRQELSLITYLTEISLRSISFIILHRSGDQDAIFTLLGSRSLVRELAEELKYNITVGGWVTEYGNLLTFATVKGGAKMVAYSQPGRTFQLFKSFVHGERLTRRNT
ncbi:putative carboxypeptidase D [Dioscorea sansibarensis]